MTLGECQWCIGNYEGESVPDITKGGVKAIARKSLRFITACFSNHHIVNVFSPNFFWSKQGYF